MTRCIVGCTVHQSHLWHRTRIRTGVPLSIKFRIDTLPRRGRSRNALYSPWRLFFIGPPTLIYFFRCRILSEVFIIMLIFIFAY